MPKVVGIAIVIAIAAVPLFYRYAAEPASKR
jgi:hypothetical protein